MACMRSAWLSAVTPIDLMNRTRFNSSNRNLNDRGSSDCLERCDRCDRLDAMGLHSRLDGCGMDSGLMVRSAMFTSPGRVLECC